MPDTMNTDARTKRAGDEPVAKELTASTSGHGGMCGGLKSNGAHCRQAAGWGTSHPGIGSCKLHGGSTPSHVAKAQNLAAAAAAVTYGAPREVDPVTALFEEVYRTAGHVAWLTRVVATLTENELVWGLTEEMDRGSGEFPGIDVMRAAKPSMWLELYMRERRHLVEVSKTVVSLSLEQRRDTQLERQAAQLALLIEGLLDDDELALTPPQRVRLVGLVVERVRALVAPRRTAVAPRRVTIEGTVAP